MKRVEGMDVHIESHLQEFPPHDVVIELPEDWEENVSTQDEREQVESDGKAQEEPLQESPEILKRDLNVAQIHIRHLQDEMQELRALNRVASASMRGRSSAGRTPFRSFGRKISHRNFHDLKEQINDKIEAHSSIDSEKARGHPGTYVWRAKSGKASSDS